MKTRYELLEHTADIGIRVEASDLKTLFSSAAYALFDIMAKRVGGKEPVSRVRHLRIELSAENIEELFVTWLNELISRAVSEQIIFTHFSIETLTQTRCTALADAESAAQFSMRTEIKAATYHQLLLKQIPHDGWRAEVIFDV